MANPLCLTEVDGGVKCDCDLLAAMSQPWMSLTLVILQAWALRMPPWQHLQQKQHFLSQFSLLRDVQGAEARRVLAAGLLVATVTCGQDALAAGTLTVEQRFVAEVWRETDRLFYERTFNGLDWFGERQALVRRQYSSAAEARSAVSSLLSRLGDAYTRYVDPESYDRLVVATSGDAAFVAGAGAQLVDSDEGVMVVDVEPGAPGEKAGMRPGDVVARVAGARVETAADAARALRGEAGSTVDVELRRANSPISAKVVRAVVPLSSVRYDNGVLRIRSFSLETANLVLDKLQAGKPPKKLVIDLRGNGGGSLEGGVETARLFLGNGNKIVTVIDKRGDPFEYAAVQDGPLSSLRASILVLVDNKTASAAEVFAAALKENGAAKLLGARSERTFGKGVIQQLAPLGQPIGSQGAVAVTLAKYTTPNGDDINGKGITVDKVLENCALRDSATACVN